MRAGVRQEEAGSEVPIPRSGSASPRLLPESKRLEPQPAQLPWIPAFAGMTGRC